MVQSSIRQAHLSLSAGSCEVTVLGAMKAGGEASFWDTSVYLIYDSAEMEVFFFFLQTNVLFIVYKMPVPE